ncbi:carbohydrate kinase family protein [Streptomyces sp. IB201691-2A2]|uniref:carbohydrate kinase family protein n=1 Tax=Streptomyces sp. IB201691-2A2 TaxID=2561920 RepID=UPI00163D64FC|nr:carbohydrate kinase family protein [Streptomyces sp. IB201691-2A2]
MILGDLRVDFRSRIRDHRFALLPSDHLEFAEIVMKVSGTAVNLARPARHHFSAVDVISCIGTDHFSSVIRSALDDLDVRCHLQEVPDIHNGTSLLVREPDLKGPRLLVASKSTPVSRLSIEHVRGVHQILESANVLFADGYLALHEASRAAMTEAARITRSAGGVFCFDLLPHHAERYFSLSELQDILEMSDIVISSARTFARLLSLDDPYPYRAEHVTALVRRNLSNTPGRDATWLLRFGIKDLQDTAVCRNGAVSAVYDTGYLAAEDKSEYGDRLAARELINHVLHGYVSPN